METGNGRIALLAWLQIFVSLLLASVIVWGYEAYQTSLGKFAHLATAAIGAVSNVVVRTAETVEAKRDLLDQTAQMFVVTRRLIDELKVAVVNQERIAPQYAEGIHSASSLAAKLGGTLASIADRLSLEMPTGISMEGARPKVTMSRPLEKQAQALRQNAQGIKVVSESLLGIAATISRDGQNLSSAFIATSDQALKVIAEAEKALGRLRTQDLPKAIEDLKATSENLRQISTQVEIVGNLGLILLIVGLLLAGWCFLHSVGMLMLANSKAPVPAAE